MSDEQQLETRVPSLPKIKQARDLPYGFAKRFGVLLTEVGGNWQVSHLEDTPLSALLEVQRHCPSSAFICCDQKLFERELLQTYEVDSSATKQLVDDINEDLDMYRTAEALGESEDLLESNDDAPIIKLINAILSQALKEKASDIHIETFEQHLTVRFRVDGVLRKVLEPQRVLAPLIISRIKVMAKLDISEKRLPQDGRITLKIAGRAVDVRVSTMPASHGERIVLRLLEKSNNQLQLGQLGLSSQAAGAMQRLIKKPHGIILVTGPTGAGKTTTLYAGLSALNQSTRNILTVEDPVEYELLGIGQTQVNTKVGMTFAKGLRAILRQDPDVVMVGEIRDRETAEIAIQASLTGHLVLSTLHTNTAIGAVTRLQDMGIERFLLSTSLIGLLAQRLVRLLCPQCKKPAKLSNVECEVFDQNQIAQGTVYQAEGCERCNQSGYMGRTGIYEIIEIDEALRRAIHDGANEGQMQAIASQAHDSMRIDGLRRVLQGETTLDEVLRVTTGN